MFSYCVIMITAVSLYGQVKGQYIIKCDDAAVATQARRDFETKYADMDLPQDPVMAKVFSFLSSTTYIKTVGYTAYLYLYLIKAYQKESYLPEDPIYDALRDLYKSDTFLPKCFGEITSDDKLPLPVNDYCCCPFPKIKCKPRDKKFRTLDGSCNCLEKPSMGRSNKAFARFLPPDYADGITKPRAAKSGNLLPSARLVSNIVYKAKKEVFSEVLTVMHMAFGQIVDHDTDRTPVSQFEKSDGTLVNIRCGNDSCDTNGLANEECLPIMIPAGDPTFAGKDCLKFVRSQAFLADDCAIGPRQQANVVTSWLDASLLYGSTVEENARLRDPNPNRGKMATIPHPLNSKCKPLIPTKDDQACRDVGGAIKCFLTGDTRQNENLGLIALHIILVRLHNFFEKELHKVNDDWDGERLFQETRKVVIAVWQNMIYNEYLPVLLGPDAMTKHKLNVDKYGCMDGDCINESVETTNVFATAAFRFGHSQIPEDVKLTDSTFTKEKLIAFPKLLFRPKEIYSTHFGDTCGVDAVLLGHATQFTDQTDQFFSSSMRDHLFTLEPPKGPGTDLPALNTQRGRDHGIPDIPNVKQKCIKKKFSMSDLFTSLGVDQKCYNKWREFCGLKVANNFDDLIDIPKKLRGKFAELYEHVDDIDLFPAGVSEDHVTGGIVGPTFACILARQFRNFKVADRFWFERCSYGFTTDQLQNIRQYSTGRLLCDTLDDVKKIQRFTMMKSQKEALEKFNINKGKLYKWISLFKGEKNNPVRCRKHPGIKFELFRD